MTSKETAVIGLTGGIASGKSFVSSLFRDRGVMVLDADEIAREVVAPGTPALEEIVETFGDGVLTDEGTLNREALAEIIFDDEEKRGQLEAITHPRIGQTMASKTTAANEDGVAWLLYDAALIVENALHLGMDGLIVVSCDYDNQIERLVERDGMSEEDAMKRIDSQLPLTDKVDAADWVIDNSGAREATEEQVEELFDRLARKFDW